MSDDFGSDVEAQGFDAKAIVLPAVILSLCVGLGAELTRSAVVSELTESVAEDADEDAEVEDDEEEKEESGGESEPGLPLGMLVAIIAVGTGVLVFAGKQGNVGGGTTDGIDEVLADVARGDLRLASARGAGIALRSGLEGVRTLIRSVVTSSDTLVDAVDTLATSSEKMAREASSSSAETSRLSATASQVSENVQTVAVGVEEMGSNIKEIAENARQASDVARRSPSTSSIPQVRKSARL